MKRITKFFIVSMLSMISLVSASFAVAFAEEQSVISTTSFTTLGSAEIKDGTPTGIRFTTEISKNDLATLPEDTVFGTLIIGTDYLGESELTLDTVDATNIVADRWYGESETMIYYTGVLVGESLEQDFPEKYYAKSLTARGYLKYVDGEGEKIVYSPISAERSMSYVAAAAIACGADTDANREFLQKIADKAVGNISFGKTEAIVPTGFEYSLVLNGTNGMPYKIEVTEGATILDGKFSAETVGSYTVTATCGSKTCEINFVVKDAIKSVAELKNVPVFCKTDISSTVELTLPTEINGENITEVYGASLVSKTETVLMANLESNGVGEKELFVVANNNVYALPYVVADEIITSAVEFNAMLEERVIKNNALDPKYYALTNDIQIADTKIITPSGRDHGNYTYEFKDTFDGRGHMISANDSEKTIWNNGMFGNVTGGTVKNLIVKDIMVRYYFSERAGAIANTLQNGGVIENVVVINPIMRSQNGNGLSFGMLVGNIYGDGIIRNCLVVDLNSFNGTNPQKSSPGDYAEGKYVGSILFNGIAGIMGGSFNADNAIDNYCITASENIFGARSSASADADAMPGTVLSSMQIFVETVGSKLQYYKLLNVEANGDITVGGIKIYSAS